MRAELLAPGDLVGESRRFHAVVELAPNGMGDEGGMAALGHVLALCPGLKGVFRVHVLPVLGVAAVLRLLQDALPDGREFRALDLLAQSWQVLGTEEEGRGGKHGGTHQEDG
ncbi:MAG: hypothetical protein HN380_28650 [Victivallales bacterium]|nr:hypothetical protein [Victivallales bacterium]